MSAHFTLLKILGPNTPFILGAEFGAQAFTCSRQLCIQSCGNLQGVQRSYWVKVLALHAVSFSPDTKLLENNMEALPKKLKIELS